VKYKTNLIHKVSQEFRNKFHCDHESISLAPGRINIIGEHTDYNNGFAMPIAINRYVCVAISKSNKDYSSVYSMNYKCLIHITNSNRYVNNDPWNRLIHTLVNELQNKYTLVMKTNIVIVGDIPIGCGLSSSTAFVIANVIAYLDLFSIEINKIDLALLCHKIECKAFGSSCGLLDQYGIIFSKKNKLLMIDFESNKMEYIPQNIKGCSWVLINSKIQRELSNSAYMERVRECRKGLEILSKHCQITNYRDINKEALSILEEENNIIFKRLLHLISENERVLNMKKAILNSDKLSVGNILLHSHQSLKELYEVSCQEIDYIIDISKDFPNWFGGRIIGGGFGGCSIHLVFEDVVDEYKNYIIDYYNNKIGIMPEVLDIQFVDGVH
tara:strand:+ start:47 stop:1201 length:1155 start_codon:yes stop_codon:yes gene_type:complete